MTLSSKSPRARSRWAALAGFVFLATVMSVSTAVASHPEVSLSGSNFEIDTDANLKVDDAAPSIDWASVTENRKQDTTSGPTDESFGQGTKEDTAVPSVVDGSIPPNKSDLKFFGVYQEGSTASGFLTMFWSRVQDPSGTTNMDFEFNQSSTLSSNGITPVRTAGDLLVIYDLSNGGTVPTLSKRTWTGTAWGPATALVGGTNASGSINTSAIPAAESDGIGSQSARTFGEAQLRLSSLFPDPTICQSFGSAYLKSRSSDSFTSAVKDFVPPISVNITNCGSIKIIKKDDADNALNGAVFTLFNDNAPVGGSLGAEDTITTKTCTTGASPNAAGECTITGVLAGEYWVRETTTPTGYTTAADQHATVTADSTVTLTFVDPRERGAIRVKKAAKHFDTSGNTSANLVATFTVKKGTTTVGTITTAADGTGCLGDLLFGNDYSISETTVPTGYKAPAQQTDLVVDTKASCPTGGNEYTFTNAPLTDITVSVNSQVAGGTGSKITCTGLTPTPSDATPTAFDDTSETVKDLVEGTYTCTIVIDP
ncbi:MAG TPA: SpaA isopeptide-forming pilin-related protein [Candidatus Limnocylindrales bacterium]|nr:SpaA isopeptide-forming pilin-related protein [Candidatus Limnocylindrales bacterium]HEV8697809.1 SpaA isopeptide-forming pilin-related protein [Candidatus Limnocylindrales bacterium]